MVGETAVDGIEQVLRVLARIDLLRKEIGHAVGQVKGNLQVREIALVLLQEGDIVRFDVDFAHRAFLRGGRRRFSLLDPGLDLAQSCIQAHRKGILTRDLHPIVFSRIVRSRNLDGSLVAVIRRPEIHQRRAAQADVVHIRTRIRNALDEIIMNLGRGNPAVTAHQDLVGTQQLRQEITHLVSHLFIEIHVVDSPYIIRMKSSHNESDYFSFVL